MQVDELILRAGQNCVHPLYPLAKPIFEVALPADDVGHRLEYFMLINDEDSLDQFSNQFLNTMNWLINVLTDKFEVKIIFFGGDNLLAVSNEENLTLDVLEKLRTEFFIKSKSTLSMGLGNNMRQAYLGLKLAKASGKNCICDFKELSDG